MSTESEYSGEETCDTIDEDVLEVLKEYRKGVVRKYSEYLENTTKCEVKDSEKYLILNNVKELEWFEDDSEDLGIREDLNFLEIE